MRTHEPKKHKCDICGRSFGLLIRLAAHKLSEHNLQPTVAPIMTSVEQEEALNDEREAREAHKEKSNKNDRCRKFSKVINTYILIFFFHFNNYCILFNYFHYLIVFADAGRR